MFTDALDVLCFIGLTGGVGFSVWWGIRACRRYKKDVDHGFGKVGSKGTGQNG